MTPASHTRTSPGVLLLEAVERLREAETLLRNRMRVILDLGGNDLQAVQLIARAELRGEPIRPSDLASALGVTTAATSLIVDRLVSRDIATRTIDPADARSKILSLTTRAHADLDAAYGELPARMRSLVDDLVETDSTMVRKLAADMQAIVDSTAL